MFPLVILSVYKCLTPEDQKYFRKSREAKFGQTLEKASSFEQHLPYAKLLVYWVMYLWPHTCVVSSRHISHLATTHTEAACA